jgi:DNA-binding response OmpR family regulator
MDILVVDDEIDIVNMIEDFLSFENINVIKATSGEEALKLFSKDIKLVVLDINMPGISGIEVCKKIRKKYFTPIIFLTCNNSQSDTLLGLGVGADDYITKPFNPIELVARIKANIRRFEKYKDGNIKEEIITFGVIIVHKKKYKVYKNNENVKITSKEFELLNYLINNAFMVLTRKQILDKVWGDTHYDENLVNTTIKRLRKKIEDKYDDPKYIKTVWGVGYVFEGEVR